MAHDRLVAGIRCFEVLERLSDYIDGELEPADREQIDAHLRDCDWCARFGGEVTDTVAEIRSALQEPEPVPAAVGQRLRAALDQGLGESEK